MTSEDRIDAEAPLDLPALVVILRDRWALIAGGIALGFVAAIGVLKFAAPVWTAQSSVLVKQESALPGLSGLALGGAGGGAMSALLGVRGSVETDMGLLQSRVLVGEVVD